MFKLFTIFFFVITLTFFGQENPVITNSVVVGGVTDSSAKFWIKISGAGFVNVELSDNSGFDNAKSTNTIELTSETVFSGIVDISGLKPDTKYFYRVLINNIAEENIERTFMTFPISGGKENFSFGFGSCQQNGGPLSSETNPGNIFNEVIKHDLKFFLQIGDWGYPDSTDNAPYDNKFFAANKSTVRQTYFNRYDPNYPMEKLFRQTPIDYVYDDHDFMNDNSSALTSSYAIAIKPNAFSDDYAMLEIQNPEGARENSITGYYENFPGYPPVNSSRGIYHKFSFGNAEFYMLDLRSQRSSNLNAFVKNNTTVKWEFKPGADHSILGRDNAPGSGQNQLDWLISNLKNSTADWKFIVSSVPFNVAQKRAVDLSISVQDELLNYPEAPPGSRGIVAAMELSDKWIGFPADQDSLLNFIENNNISNVVVLSGDAHTAAIDDGSNAGLPEIMAANLDIKNSRVAGLLNFLGIKMWNKGGQGISTDQYNNAFGKVSVYGADSLNLSLIDEYGLRIASYTINKTSTDIESRQTLPLGFKLEQNYPNPFNPTTVIRYQLEFGSQVTLKVYDILGNEVTTLVDEYKPAGEYKIEFSAKGKPGSAEDLTSGVYFYQLIAGEYIRTKKMIILR